MISSGVEGAGPESRVAGWAASAAGDDAAAARAVIEAYGGRLAAADVAGVVSQHAGRAAVMQPGLETAVNGDLAPVRAASQETITIRAAGETQPARLRQLFALEARGARGRSRSTWASRCRSSQEGAAPASSESATRMRAPSASACGRRARRGAGGHADLPARTGAVQADAGVAGAVRVPALGVAAAAGGRGLPPAPRH